MIFRDSEIGDAEIAITATDPFGAASAVRFRVEVVDLLLSSASSGSNLRVFPNPTPNTLLLEIPLDFPEKGELVLSDLQGKEILRSVYQGRLLEINLSSVESGVYFLSINTTKKSLQTKIIKR